MTNLSDTYTRLRSRLKKMASSILNNEEDAEDALQDAFCRLLLRETREPDSTSSDGLVVTAVKRICLSYLRKRSTHASEPIEEREMAVSSTIRSIWEEEEMADFHRRLMSKLSETQKTVFEMVSNGIDYDIIALRLEMSEEAVRQHVSRARKILKNEYKNM